MSEVVLLIALPLFGAGVALTAKVFAHSHGPMTLVTRLARATACLPLIGLGVLLARLAPVLFGDLATVDYALGGWALPVGIVLKMDGLAWISSLLVVVIAVPVALVALSDSSYDLGFFFFFMVLVAGMQMVVVTDDLFTMFVAFEVVAIAAYVLIAYEQSDTGLLASLKYLFLSSVGVLFFLFGVLIVYRSTGTLSLTMLAEAGAASGSPLMGRPVRLALAALVVGVGVRTAFIPFHTWLPEAHAYAPHPISALLSGALIKVSLFALVRLVVTFGAGSLDQLFVWVGAVTAVVAVVWALAQHDVKRLLAYHSISQMGFILAAFGAGGSIGIIAAMAHAVNHALFKSLLFLAIGAAIPFLGSRNLYRMQPLRLRLPLVSVAIAVGALSIAGVPPFNGFASKAYVSAAMYGSAAYPLLQIAAIGTAASFMKVARFAVVGPPAAAALTSSPLSPASPASPRSVPWQTRVALGFLAMLCVAAGLWAAPTWRAAGPALALAVGAPDLSSAAAAVPNAFGRRNVVIAIATVVAGVPVYFAAISRLGNRLATRVSGAAPDLGSVLALFLAGLSAVAAVALLG